jgi:TfoX/Sxy family transcriptional regulator of competence genes
LSKARAARIPAMPYDQILAERIREALREKGIEFEAKPIMGMLCFMVNGTLCAGVLDRQLIVRIDPANEHIFHAKPGCKPMYFTGRLMKDFMFIDSDGTHSREQILEWLEFALKVVREQSGSKRQRPLDCGSVPKDELPGQLTDYGPERSAE